METNAIDRFLDAQKNTYDHALREIQAGEKTSHWMWFIFPQIKGLGKTYTADYYGIENLDEAKAYLSNETLCSRLIEISEALLKLETNDPIKIFGYTDSLKLKSSMTLFLLADENCKTFQAVLDKFYDGKKDNATIRILTQK